MPALSRFKKLKSLEDHNRRYTELISERAELSNSIKADEQSFSEAIVNGDDTAGIEKRIERSKARIKAIDGALRQLEAAITPLAKQARIDKMKNDHEARLKQFDAAVPALKAMFEKVSAEIRDAGLMRTKGEGNPQDLSRGSFERQLYEHVERMSRPPRKPSRVEPDPAELAFIKAQQGQA